MKISIMSDLHLEFGDIELPGGDVIVLAGDIFVAATMLEDRTDARADMQRTRFIKFAKKELSKYRRGVMVLGNHEFYGGNMMDTPEIVRNFLGRYAPHITLLDDQVEVIHGVTFIGSTLWAPYGHRNPVDKAYIQMKMNDFKQITTNSFTEDRITPDIIEDNHTYSVQWLWHILNAYSKQPCVVITHHAPSLLALDGGGHGYGTMDSAYASNQHALIEANPQIALWAYGHCHSHAHFKVGETTVVSNPRGYDGYERISKTFDATAEDFEIVT